MAQKMAQKKIKSVVLVYRSATPEAINLAQSLCTWLKERNLNVFTGPDQKIISGSRKLTSKNFDLVIALGGDGTYLRAVRMLDGRSIPILGINLGSLGFLTPTRANELFTAVEMTLKGKMKLKPRAMLEVELVRKGKTKYRGLALNDVVLERGSLSQLISTNITCDGFSVSDVKADGMIISSPTGSTAYNLAAGGPILDPESQVLVISPISPHTLTSRPLIVPDSRVLSFRLVGRKHSAHLVVDGQIVGLINNDDELFIQRSAHDHWMVCDPQFDYYHLLREKLRFGDRPTSG